MNGHAHSLSGPERRRPIIGGNWKMNTTLPGAADLAADLVRYLNGTRGVDIVLCPPFPNLESVGRVIAGSPIALGAQDVYWADAGAYTGEVSAPMLVGVGCEWTIVGHSERRRGRGESSAVVHRKLRAALRHGLSVIMAVGETREERHSGQMEAVLATQLRESLGDVSPDEMATLVIAYEPVWAIGTGETATPEQARDAHAFVRHTLAEMYGVDIATATRIQYGGSVTAANAEELMAEGEIDGALVGGASLKPSDFAAIVRAAVMRA